MTAYIVVAAAISVRFAIRTGLFVFLSAFGFVAHSSDAIGVSETRAFTKPQIVAQGSVSQKISLENLVGGPANIKYTPGELLVKFTSAAVSPGQKFIQSQAIHALKEHGHVELDYLVKRKNINPYSTLAQWRVVRLPKGITMKEAIELFSNDPNVEVVEVNAIARTQR